MTNFLFPLSYTLECEGMLYIGPGIYYPYIGLLLLYHVVFGADFPLTGDLPLLGMNLSCDNEYIYVSMSGSMTVWNG